MPERYKDLKDGSLFDYIPPEKFRTITARQRAEIPPGVSEFPVELQLKHRMKDKLSFKFPWDGIIYGCARTRYELEEKFGSKINQAFIMDWDDKFLLMFEFDGKIDHPVIFVKIEDVAELLENCWRCSEHR